MLNMSAYKNMEEILKLINTKYVSLDNDIVKHNNERLRSTLWDLIAIMKKEDPLFDKLFERPYFGGSYYDDLKVGKPDEFDLDLLLVIPEKCETHKSKNCGCVTVIPSNVPGFFWFKIKENYYTPLNKFIKDDYLQIDLILNWMKSRVTDALNRLRNLDFSSLHQFSVVDPPTYYSESGPAFTLRLWGEFGHFDVDLVPAFKFGPEYWPKEGFRSNQTAKPDFFLVPKTKSKELIHCERYWRSSFQDQEKEIIKGKERLKPALRLLKKMRNNLVQSKISSYALKNIVLWEMDTTYFNWNETLSDTFIKLLEKYKDSLHKKRIAYYWNKNYNLLHDINPITLENHHNEISRLLKRVKDQHMTNPCIVAKVILKEGTNEYNEFIAECNQENRVSTTNEMAIRSSNQGSSCYTFDPSSTAMNSMSPTSVRNSYATASTGSSYSSQNTTQQVVGSSTSGWATAGGVILGVGAVAAVGFGIFKALNNNNRNQNR